MLSGICNGCSGSASCWCRSDAVWHLQELVKLSMLLALFGGCGKAGTEPGMGKRGSIHVLICGDPGLGKSQLLQVCRLPGCLGGCLMEVSHACCIPASELWARRDTLGAGQGAGWQSSLLCPPHHLAYCFRVHLRCCLYGARANS